MLARTHLAFGISLGLLILNFINPSSTLLFFSGLILGTLIVDIDHPNSTLGVKLKPFTDLFSFLFGHRGIFHSLLFAILLPGLVWYFLSKDFGLAMFIGYLAHILFDGLTEAGVNLLHPFANLRISGFVKTGGIIEHIIFFSLIIFLLSRFFVA